jgi:Acetyltransferase (GNAT) domain
MKYVSRNDINIEKWNACIANSTVENIFCYSWYLDAVSKNWAAFIYGDYETVVPIPFTNKIGVKSMYQPAFTREIDIFGKDFHWDDLLLKLEPIVKSVHFRNRQSDIIAGPGKRNYQYLDLSGSIVYKTNAKRLVKKASQMFDYSASTQVTFLIKLFKETAFQKIDTITADDVIKLEELMMTTIDNKKGELLMVTKNGEDVAAGFFLKDKERVTYLKGAAFNEDKKQGAMFGLMDHAIQKYSDQGYKTFDFGGSDIENVATFYKKFGAIDCVYFDYIIDNLPFWYKTLKKLRK